jgi:hypothetical protein
MRTTWRRGDAPRRFVGDVGAAGGVTGNTPV